MFLEYTGHLAEAEDIYIKLYNQISMDVTDYDVVLLRASVAHHIGNIYTDYAPEKALPFLTEAKNIVWNFLSPTHPDTLDVLNSICSLQLTINDNFSEILSDLQQLLELYLNVYGENNPQVGTIYNNIGLCYYYMDKPYEAISKYEEAVQISILSYGKDYPLTAYIYNNIGAAYSGTSHPEKAITEHEHALRIFEAAYPNKQNLDFALTHADLANCYLREKNIENTMKHLNEAFSIYQNMLPENAHQLIYPYCTLANLMVLLGDYENAVINFLHVVWLLLENGYDQNSDTVKDIVSKVSQLQKLVCNEEKQ